MNYHQLLGRDPVDISLNRSLKYVKNKRILITGGGGSIGSELARQLFSGGAARLYLFGHGENSIFKITEELLVRNEKESKSVKIVPIIGELQDREYVHYITKKLEADLVFHTAAHKHVHLMEDNPVEVIKNNVFGTKNIVEASRKADVEKFVLISSDKAVEPSCIYGISKFLSEEIVLKEGKDDHKFLVLRFGNVLGSKGSFIHTFEEQIKNTLPITITDERMKRFFMTIPEAVSFIIKIGDIGQGGELYYLNMGEQIYIKDIAQKMMKIYNKEVPIVYTGIRPGEKLEERLWTSEEEPENTRYRGIVRLKKKTKINDIDMILRDLKPICFYDSDFSEIFRDRKSLTNILSKLFYEKKD
jgi:FlaA1/EpsC-like NDP-sugar epimerase